MRKLSLISICIHLVLSISLAQNIFKPAEYGDRLKIGYIDILPAGFNPMITRSEYDKELNKLIFGDGIFTRAAEGHVIHGLALSSEREQPRVWRINLRSDISFHDGSEITADDVKFTFDLYKKFALHSHQLFEMRLVSAIEVLSNRSLRIFFKQPLRDFRETIGQLPILPRKHYEKWKNYNLLSSLPYIQPVGSGHFLYRRHLGREIQMDVYQNHYRKRANLNGVDVLLFDTHEKMVDAFVNGHVDLITVQGRSQIQKIIRLASKPQFVTVKRDESRLYFILLNTRKPPFNDVQIRRVFNYAINKKRLVQRNLDNQGHVAYYVLDENSEFYFPAARSYNYDPLRSLNILRSSGYRQRNNGKLFLQNRELKFEFYFNEGSVFEETIARLTSINLAELGINMIPRPKKPGELEQLVREGEYQAALRSFIYNPETPAQVLREFYLKELKSENGYRNFNDRVLNSAIAQSEKATRVEQLSRIMRQMHVQINQFSPAIFLFFEDRIYYVIHDRFENTNNRIFQKLEYVVKLNPKNEWSVPKSKQEY